MVTYIKAVVEFIRNWAKGSWLKAAIAAFLLGGIPGLVYFVSPEIGNEVKQAVQEVIEAPVGDASK